MNRRDMIKNLSWGFWATGLFSSFSNQNTPAVKGPLVLCTWDNQKNANVDAWKVLSMGGNAIDAVEIGVQNAENDWNNCCVGLGGNPDRTGKVTLDACIMDHQFNIGAVAAIERIKNPIRVARAVMEKTPHVMLVGEGAQKFALEQGFTLESEKLSDHAAKAFDDWKTRNQTDYINIEKKRIEYITKPDNELSKPKVNKADEFNHDTIGMIAIDREGNLSGACTTSGMGFKMRGRVGDSPIIGAGLYVDNEVGAATATGHGEEVIRICGSHLVVEFMREGLSPELACRKAVERIKNRTPRALSELQIGFIALNKRGEFGGYALQKGFDYAVMSEEIENKKIEAPFILSGK